MVARLVYTTIRAPRGRLVHAISIRDSVETACRKPCRGWKIASTECGEMPKVTCQNCVAAVFYPVRTKRSSR